MDAIGGSRACRGEAGGLGRASLTVRMPLAVGRRPGPKTVVTLCVNAPGAVRTRADPTLLKHWHGRTGDRRCWTTDGMCRSASLGAAEKIERGFADKMLSRTLLEPDMLEAIVDGHDVGLSLPAMVGGLQQVWAMTR